MLFGALFSAYALLRASATDWPTGHVLNRLWGWLGTSMLLNATWYIWAFRRTPAMTRRSLLFSSLMALCFLGMKSIEWSDDFDRGLFPRVSTFLALYFTLTGLHALHVIAGLVGNVWVLRGRVDDA